MTTMNRRKLLKSSLPSLGAAIASGAVASSMDDQAETPIQALYRDWADLGNRYGNAIDANNALSERLKAEDHPDRYRIEDDHYKEHAEPLETEFGVLENKLMAIPAQDTKDLAIKARISVRVDGVIDDEFNRLIRADADRLLGHVNV